MPLTSAAPTGLLYQPDFVTPDEERHLIEQIERLPMAPFVMRGVRSKRLVLHFGWDYDYDQWTIRPAAPLPDFLLKLRKKAAVYFAEEPDRFEEALINGYPAGTGIGWHRDAPMFGTPVLGISLGSACWMRFRRKKGESYEIYKQWLEPRSLYAMSGEARSAWQHTIPATRELRYSVTFRNILKRPN
jgi:DNA oxidative demethylase